jgi:ABC-type phosphate transport system substrate-binding protein
MAVTATLFAVFCGVWIAPEPSGADTTDSSTLVGEGGSFLTPVTNLLLRADTAGIAPLNPSYNDANVDNAISDFVGNGPGSFDADFVVSERPLTATEAATAASDGRSFAYVPFAATPVAIATLAVCNPSAIATDSPSALCRNIPLTVPLVAAVFTDNLTTTSVQPSTGLFPALTGWSDPRLTQAGGAPIDDPSGIFQASTLSPSAENAALMALIDSNPTAREQLDNALNNPEAEATTKSDTPSETWPFQGNHAFVGGDEGLIGKELSINAETNAPSALLTWTGLGVGATGPHDVFPVSAVWTGAPEGTPWNVPTADIQNAQSAFVGPTEAAAAAAETHVTLDPTTNLVTFNADASDAGAYNNYLMVESYLVVPTSGLPADKAEALAQYIRFIVGPTGQSDEAVLGSAPPTPAMVTADLKVAAELDAEAVRSSSGTTTKSTTTTSTTTTSPTSSSQSTSGSTTSTTSGDSVTSDWSTGSADSGSSSSTGSSADSDGDGSSQDLAFTGAAAAVPVGGAGVVLVLLGVVGRRRFRRKEVKL